MFIIIAIFDLLLNLTFFSRVFWILICRCVSTILVLCLLLRNYGKHFSSKILSCQGSFYLLVKVNVALDFHNEVRQFIILLIGYGKFLRSIYSFTTFFQLQLIHLVKEDDTIYINPILAVKYVFLNSVEPSLKHRGSRLT